MASYSLSVPYFYIAQIRSANSDTLAAAVSLRVMNAEGGLHNQWDPMHVSLGDHHQYDRVDLKLTYDNVDVPDPTDESADGGAIYWNFTLVNSANANDAQFIAVLDDAANAVVGALVSTGNIVGILAAGGIEGAKALVDALQAGHCDGVVAAQEWSLTAAQLWARTNGAVERWDAYEDYPGTDSPWGCGANSDYQVAYSISRTGKPKEKEKDKDKEKEHKEGKDFLKDKDLKEKDRDSVPFHAAAQTEAQRRAADWPLAEDKTEQSE